MRELRDRGALDIFCPITFSFDGNLDREGAPPGTETWWYVCWIPPFPAPNVMVDNSPLQQRIIGWQSWRFGVTGFLYWDTIRAHWDNRTEYAPPSADCGSVHNGGDGTLLYHIDGKWTPSLRLRHLADGMEDLQLVRMLEELWNENEEAGPGPDSPAWREACQAARLALGRASRLAYTDHANAARLVEAYDKDPGELMATRQDLADAIMAMRRARQRQDLDRDDGE